MSRELIRAFDGYYITWVVDDAGDVFTVNKHLCAALGYADAKQAMEDHCRWGGLRYHPIVDSLGRTQQARLIHESDVYRLITHSKLPAAKRFEKWVFEEVLPSIRKTGQYQAPQSFEAMTLAVVTGLQKRLDDAKAELLEAKPKVEFYDAFADASGRYGLQNAARALSQPPNKWIASLERDGYLFRQGGQLVPMARYVESGLFEVKTTVVNEYSRVQAFVTPKGFQHFAKRLQSPPLMLEGPEVCQ